MSLSEFRLSDRHLDSPEEKLFRHKAEALGYGYEQFMKSKTFADRISGKLL